MSLKRFTSLMLIPIIFFLVGFSYYYTNRIEGSYLIKQYRVEEVKDGTIDLEFKYYTSYENVLELTRVYKSGILEGNSESGFIKDKFGMIESRSTYIHEPVSNFLLNSIATNGHVSLEEVYFLYNDGSREAIEIGEIILVDDIQVSEFYDLYDNGVHQFVIEDLPQSLIYQIDTYFPDKFSEYFEVDVYLTEKEVFDTHNFNYNLVESTVLVIEMRQIKDAIFEFLCFPVELKMTSGESYIVPACTKTDERVEIEVLKND